MAEVVARGSRGAIRVYGWSNEQGEHLILRCFGIFFADF